MTLYKVVTKDRESLSVTSPRYKRKYTKGKTVTAARGSMGLFCFSDADDAKWFIWRARKPGGLGRRRMAGAMVITVKPIRSCASDADWVIDVRKYPPGSSRWQKLNRFFRKCHGELPRSNALYGWHLAPFGALSVRKLKVLT